MALAWEETGEFISNNLSRDDGITLFLLNYLLLVSPPILIISLIDTWPGSISS